jgi:hypothetical protein
MQIFLSLSALGLFNMKISISLSLYFYIKITDLLTVFSQEVQNDSPNHLVNAVLRWFSMNRQLCHGQQSPLQWLNSPMEAEMLINKL